MDPDGTSARRRNVCTATERLHGDGFSVNVTGDKVTWDFGGLEFIAAPLVWTIEGKAGDAELDLVDEQVGAVLWN